MKVESLVPWLVAGLSGYVLYLLAPILTPFVASALIAYLGDPLVDRLERWRLSRTLAVVVTFVLFVVAASTLLVLVLPLVRAQISALLENLPGYVDWLESRFLPQLKALVGLPQEEDLGLGALLSRYGSEFGNLASNTLVLVSRKGTAFVAALASLMLVPIITFYLMRDWDLLIARLAAMVPPSMRERAIALARESDEVLGGFLRGQLSVMLALAIIYSAGLAILGLDFWLAIGVVAGLVSFVPYLGLIVGIGLAGLATMAQTGSVPVLAGVVAVFVVAQLIEGSFLTPKLVGDRIGLHPVLVIFAVLAGGQLFGFFGVLLALPLAAVLTVLVRFFYHHYYASRHLAAAQREQQEPEP